MKSTQITFAAIVIMLTALIGGCLRNPATVENQDSTYLSKSRGEHDRESLEHGRKHHVEHDRRERSEHGAGSEEAGTKLALNEIYDEVRHGARLILVYDPQSNSFIGTLENTTDKTLKRVRVEVHLTNGKELGPTTPVDLHPGEKRSVKLTATSRGFDGWTAHPEVGSDEHGNREGHGEHDRREGRSEGGTSGR